MTLSSSGTPSTHGSLISRLPAFDAFQRGFTNCSHAFKQLVPRLSLAYLIVFQILHSFAPFPFGDRAVTSTDVFLLLLSCFPLLVSLLSFFGISDRCHVIALSLHYSAFEELHATCKYFTLLGASYPFFVFIFLLAL